VQDKRRRTTEASK